jgi:hypothetical protein
VTALCDCHRCDYELRRIASDAGDVKARARMTEPERRRAAGEAPFYSGDNPSAAREAAWFLRSVAVCALDKNIGPYARGQVGVMLRALVLQELLVTFSLPWGSAEVSP